MKEVRRPIVERLLRWLLRAHPREFRERFGADVEREAMESLRSGRRSAIFLAGDGLLTLVRAWSRALVERVRSWSGAFSPGSGGQDVRLAFRSLHRHPLHAAVVIATLAVAIGANTAVYTVAHGLLVRSLPYDEPDRIVRVWPMAVGDILEHPAIEVHARYSEDAGANLVEGSEATRIRLAQVSSEFIRVMGVTPLLGRGWEGDEGAGEALLSHGLWTRAFGGDREVVGRDLLLNGRTFRIAGVLPPDVDFPVGAEVWVSLPLVPEFFGGAIGSQVVARMRPGVSPAGLEAALRSGARGEMTGRDVPEEYWLPEVIPLVGDLTGPVRLPLLILSGAAGLVLLLGCANVAGISLARLSAREQELALRGALGARRGRVFRQLAVETAVPAVLAGALSVLVARGGVAVIRALLPPKTPNLAALVPGPELAWATAVTTVAAGLLAGLLPALHGSSRLRGVRAGATATDDPGRQRVQAGLAVAQVALAVVLVTGAALVARSLARLYEVPLGFDVQGVLTFEVRLPRGGYPDDAAWRGYAERAEAALRGIPGVEHVGATSRLPLAEGLSFGFDVRPEGSTDAEGRSAVFTAVTPGYFEAIGSRVLEGAALEGGGNDDVVAVSRSLARSLFPDGSALGRTVRIVRGPQDEGTPVRVAGVVEDVRSRGPEAQATRFMVYEALSRSPRPYLGFALRYRGDAGELAPAVREVLHRVDASVPPFAVRTTAQAVAETMAVRRSVAVVSSLFGAVALLLAVLGVYGLMAHAVSRRRRELGIRMALGAGSGQVTRMVLRRGFTIAAAGIGLGLLGSLAANRVLASLLYEVSVTDPVTFLIVPLVIAGAALLACWIPARRAARTDPVGSLRAE